MNIIQENEAASPVKEPLGRLTNETVMKGALFEPQGPNGGDPIVIIRRRKGCC